MSGIINKVEKHKDEVVLLFLMLAMVAIFLFFKMYISSVIIIFLAVANGFTVRKIKKQKAPFGTYSKIRNSDCLVIGDITPKYAQALSDSDVTISIFLPDCTLAGAYEVLRHTFSILKESGGTVILAVRKKNIGKVGYSPFDIDFFHRITINRLRIKSGKLMTKFPILFAPLKSMKFLFNVGKPQNMKEYFDRDIVDFCLKREIDIRILEI